MSAASHLFITSILRALHLRQPRPIEAAREEGNVEPPTPVTLRELESYHTFISQERHRVSFQIAKARKALYPSINELETGRFLMSGFDPNTDAGLGGYIVGPASDRARAVLELVRSPDFVPAR